MRSSRISVDASTVVRLVAFPKDHAVYQRWEAWEEQGTHLVAPTLLYYEVTNALYRY